MLNTSTIPITLQISSSVLSGLKNRQKDPSKRIDAALKKSLGVTLKEFVHVTLKDCAHDANTSAHSSR